MKMYLELYHGRSRPTEELDDWGTQGPVFALSGFCHGTYATDLKFGENGDHMLHFHDDYVFYDGVWYADFNVFSAEDETPFAHRLQEFDREKAVCRWQPTRLGDRLWIAQHWRDSRTLTLRPEEARLFEWTRPEDVLGLMALRDAYDPEGGVVIVGTRNPDPAKPVQFLSFVACDGAIAGVACAPYHVWFVQQEGECYQLWCEALDDYEQSLEPPPPSPEAP
jgi:hypothetical protein